MLFQTLLHCLSLGSIVLGSTVPPRALPLNPSPVIAERQVPTSTQVPDGQCTHGPRTRACWSRGFSIATDFDDKAPPAGKEVVVSLVC